MGKQREVKPGFGGFPVGLFYGILGHWRILRVSRRSDAHQPNNTPCPAWNFLDGIVSNWARRCRVGRRPHPGETRRSVKYTTIVVPERWLSGRKRRFAKSVTGSNWSAGSNPVLSALFVHARRKLLCLNNLRRACFVCSSQTDRFGPFATVPPRNPLS